MEPFFLQTKRLKFRLWTTDDLDLALGLWGDIAVTRLIDARGQLSKAQVQQRLLQEIGTHETHGVQYWPIFLTETGEHVGCCGLRPYDLSKNIYEFGVHLRADYWGHGYATEAAQRVMRYAFEDLQIASLFAGHNPHNTVSRHLLQKLGFQYTHDEFYEATGLQHPSYLLTEDTYRQMIQR